MWVIFLLSPFSTDHRQSQSDPDVQGTVDTGILAASWSPDDTLLTLATSMSPTVSEI